MKKFSSAKAYFLSFLCVMSMIELSSQDTPCEEIGISNPLNLTTSISPSQITPGDEFCVEFNAEFFTSINTFQFTLVFDPTELTFVSFTDNQAALIDPILPNLLEIDNGLLPLVWFNFATTGLSIPDGTNMFTICFRAGPEASDCTPISITNALAPLFPDTEVNYQVSENERCQSEVVTINGLNSDCFEIECDALSISNLGICNSTSNMASVSFSACGGNLPYVYAIERNNIIILTDTIFNDFDRIELNNMPSLTFTLRITDAAGTTITRPLIIEAIDPVSFDPPVVTDPICSNISNGSISIDNIVSGISGELFDVAWSNGITFQDVNASTLERLFNGDYSVTITDGNGCETVEDFTLFTPPLELALDLTPASCFGSDDGAISAVASGGTPINGNEYNYNGQIQQSFLTVTPFEDNAFNNITNQYRLRVSDANGCSIEENITIPTNQEIEIELNNVVDISCKGDCNGSTTLNVLTPGRYTFLVRDQNNDFVTAGASNGSSLFFDEELCAGRYSVVVQDTSGCQKDTIFFINEPDELLSVETIGVQASCNTEDGSATLNVTGGMQPYTYDWEAAPGNNSSILAGVMAGRYNVMIVDDLGCSIDTFVDVLSGDFLEIEAFVLNGLECDGTGTGQLDVNILNTNSSNHIFEWTDINGNFLDDMQQLNFNSPGSYIVNVSSLDNDCMASDTIEIIPGAGLSLEITSTIAGCPESSDASIEITNITGGVPPYECSWDIPGLDSCNPTGLMAGIYNLTITDSEGCTKDTFVEVSSNNISISFDITGFIPSCPGESDGRINLTNFSGGTGPYTCSWDIAGVTSCEATMLAEGTYNITVTDANGCMTDTSYVLGDGISNISFDLDILNPECGGDLGSITISNVDGANLPIDIEWSEPGLSGNVAMDLNAGDYTISFIDARGCSRDTSITLITIARDLEVTIDATPPDCAVGLDNGSISFPGFDGLTGTCEWGDPDLNAQNCTLIGLAPGIYNVTLTDANGCSKDTFVDLRVTERLEIELSNITDASCSGLADGTAIASVINNPLGASNLNFFWTNPADNGTGLSDDANQLSAGQNQVYAFDGLCTSDTIVFTIDEPEPIMLMEDASIIGQETCAGECDASVFLVATGGNGGYSYMWNDGFNGDMRNDLCAGDYTISISDANNCETTIDISIDAREELTARIDSSAISLISCGNDDTGALTVIAEGGCGNYAYSWTPNVSSGPTANKLSAGIYTITVTDDCGCTTETQYEFEASTPIIAEALDPGLPLCPGDQVCIGVESVSGGTGQNYTYSINFGSRLPIDSCVMVSAGNYTLLVFDSAGCSTELSVSVAAPPNFEVDLGDDIQLDLGDNSTSISVDVTGGIPAISYEWFTDAEFECSNPECSSASITAFGPSTVQVIATDSNGCTAADELNIEIKAERNVYLPNIFNPENLPPDNKFMILTGTGVEQVLSFRIFDRWGNLMFEKENIAAPTSSEDGWDGRKGDGGNNKVEQGVYVYTAEVRFIDGVVLTYRGEITLVR